MPLTAVVNELALEKPRKLQDLGTAWDRSWMNTYTARVRHLRSHQASTPEPGRETLPLAMSLQRPLLTKFNIWLVGKGNKFKPHRSIFTEHAMNDEFRSKR